MAHVVARERKACTAWTAGIGLLLLGACFEAPEPTYEERVAAEIESAFATSFAVRRPDLVVVTFPRTVGDLPPLQQTEVEIVRRVLDRESIPYALKRRDDVLVDLELPGRKVEHVRCYEVPDDRVDSLAGGMLLYINLDVDEQIETWQHPLAKERAIKVVVWNDPVSLSGSAPRRRPSS